MRRILIFKHASNKMFVNRVNIQTFFQIFKLCVIQQQVPLPLPCVNFAQITTLSLTDLRVTILVIKYFNEGSTLNN